MKIAFIITSLTVGGAERQVVSLADQMASAGHSVLVISLTEWSFVLPRNPAVQVRLLGMTKTPLAIIRSYWKARGLLRSFAPDVVHSHMVHANLFARLLRLSIFMPRLVCTAHNTNEGPYMWAYRLTDSLADITTNVSQEAVNRYVDHAAAPPHKIMTMFNGIDCGQFRFDPNARKTLRAAFDIPNDTKILMAAGRLCAQKDFPNLLKAFARLTARHPDCRLWIAGEGPEQVPLQTLTRELGLEDKVRFLGLYRDMPALMSAADIFVLSSAWEGFPLVVGEAMACERIVVSTDAGGIKEWLGDTGYIVPVRNTEALANALDQALSLGAEELHDKGRIARERVSAHYSLSAVAARWQKIYQGDYLFDAERACGALQQAKEN